MRYFTTALAIGAIALSLAACSGKSDSDQSSASATSAAATAAADASSTDANASPAAAATDSGASTAMAKADAIPSYPGAATAAAGSSEGMGGMGAAAGKVLTTSDPFDKVYAWYQKNMPAGSEKAHITAPTESAVFTVGDPGSDQTSVTINSMAGKTMITIGHVKK